MNIHKLFQVLVVSGSLMSGISIANQNPVEMDTSTSIPNPILRDAEPEPCFCNSTPEKCCEQGTCGKKHVKDGFECCWGTLCEDN